LSTMHTPHGHSTFFKKTAQRKFVSPRARLPHLFAFFLEVPSFCVWAGILDGFAEKASRNLPETSAVLPRFLVVSLGIRTHCDLTGNPPRPLLSSPLPNPTPSSRCPFPPELGRTLFARSRSRLVLPRVVKQEA
jgi:hypothetical protein